jgi:acyl-coenzyme A thioesterase 9
VSGSLAMFQMRGIYRRSLARFSTQTLENGIIKCSGEDAIQSIPVCAQMFSSLGAPKSILDDRVFVKVLPQELRANGKDQPRNVANSWVRWNLPMRSHPQMFEQFSLFGTDQIRVGKVLEILDAFSAEVGYRHVGFQFDEHTIVTACLDRLDFFDKLSMKEDLQVEGFVTRVGKSSIDVQVDLSAEKSGYIGKAVFLLVSRDLKKDIAKTVPRLILETDEEKERERTSAISREIKKKQSQSSVWKIPPTADESRIIHGLFRKYRESTDSSSTIIPMSKTIVSKTLIMQRQYRNIHNKSNFPI